MLNETNVYVKVCRNKLSNPCCLGRASFTDYSKATRVRKFYTAYTGVVETNYINLRKLIPTKAQNNHEKMVYNIFFVQSALLNN